MAIVHEVLDRATGRRVAQKRLRPQESEQRMQRTRELFEREFHTLAQLAHPRVVEVYDYGVDERGPYYTMELLDGGDLERLVPGPYRRVCAIARDVCSALSLLHSRRIVHRDVSPRNVRCTSDGLAKLIDFGAMTRMGVIKDLVGTPVYCPPEVLHLQAIDGRADLYALGATLYYVLTGRHAYPVREFAALPKAWQFGIARASELDVDDQRAILAAIGRGDPVCPAELLLDARDQLDEVGARRGRLLGRQLDRRCIRHHVADEQLAGPARSVDGDRRDGVEPQQREVGEVVARERLATQVGVDEPQAAEAPRATAHTADVGQEDLRGVADHHVLDRAAAVDQHADLTMQLRRLLCELRS
jgi:hypothetical protein